jgi:cellulose biosynthesis protein BcsQ
MKIVGVYNIKGGVGKTATTVNLAYLAAQQGFRTLVWDLDPQGAASFYFRIKPKIKGGSKRLLKGRSELEAMVKGTDFDNLDLLPADFSYRHMDLELEESNKPTKQLLRLLRPMAEDYDLVFLDCPPSISLVSENIFRAADMLLVPMIPTTLSLRTLQQLSEFLKENIKLKNLPVRPFFSMADRRKRMHQELMASLPTQFPGFLNISIPYASDVERMGEHRAPIGYFSPGSKAHQAYQELWQEAQQLL